MPADGASVVDQAALSRLAEALGATAHAGHVAGVSPAPAAALLLEPGANGIGWAFGRYAGRLTLDGSSILIDPRMGWDALDGWVAAAAGFPVAASPDDDPHARLSKLVSTLWVGAVDGASRHGPPAFRRDVRHVGSSVRGNLDVRRTVRLRAAGASSVASVYRARELDNPVTRIIVAADRVLARQVRHSRARIARVDAVLAQLHTAVGRRSPIPGDGELHRMRYTPITRPFKWAAELSSRIVRQDPLATTALSGRVQGLVLDLDGICAEAALSWAREARPDLRADSVDSGQIVLRDRHELRAVLRLLSSAPGFEGPVLELAGRRAAAERLELPEHAGDASRAVRRALAAV